MKVKNISASLITLRCAKGKDIILPQQSVAIKKENEEYANILIDEGKLKEIKETATKTKTTDL